MQTGSRASESRLLAPIETHESRASSRSIQTVLTGVCCEVTGCGFVVGFLADLLGLRVSGRPMEGGFDPGEPVEAIWNFAGPDVQENGHGHSCTGGGLVLGNGLSRDPDTP